MQSTNTSANTSTDPIPALNINQPPPSPQNTSATSERTREERAQNIENKEGQLQVSTLQKCKDTANWLLRSSITSASTKALTLANYGLGFFSSYFPTVSTKLKTANTVAGIVNTLLDHSSEHAKHQASRNKLIKEQRDFDKYIEIKEVIELKEPNFPADLCCISKEYGIEPSEGSYLVGGITILTPVLTNIFMLTGQISEENGGWKFWLPVAIGAVNMIVRWIDEYLKHRNLDGKIEAYQEASKQAGLEATAYIKRNR